MCGVPPELRVPTCQPAAAAVPAAAHNGLVPAAAAVC